MNGNDKINIYTTRTNTHLLILNATMFDRDYVLNSSHTFIRVCVCVNLVILFILDLSTSFFLRKRIKIRVSISAEGTQGV